MMDLVTFIKARLDEDEAVARAAAADHKTAVWDFDSGDDSVTPDTGSSYVACGPWGGMDEASGTHIARWDPARVLAEVDAKRRIIDEHAIGNDACDAHGPDFDSIDCETMLMLALPYRDHSEYRPEWRESLP